MKFMNKTNYFISVICDSDNKILSVTKLQLLAHRSVCDSWVTERARACDRWPRSENMSNNYGTTSNIGALSYRYEDDVSVSSRDTYRNPHYRDHDDHEQNQPILLPKTRRDNWDDSAYTMLMDRSDDADPETNQYGYCRGDAVSILTFVLALCIIASIVTFVGVYSYPSDSSTTVTEYTQMDVTVRNNYGEATAEKYPYYFLNKNLFAEVYQNNTLEISNTQSGCLYSYSINLMPSTELVQEGVMDKGVIYFQPTAPGEYLLTFNDSCHHDNIIMHKKTIYSKYVRRNILDLTEEDRERFLDAYHKLWHINTSYGKVLYGENYRSMNYISMIYNDGSTNGIYDQFHDDNGYLPNHAWLSALVEQSLQLIDPKTCLPMYNFPREFASLSYINHLENQLDGGKWSAITSSRYFGNNDPVTGRIVNSRWENATVPIISKLFYQNEDISEDKTFFPKEDKMWYKVFNISHIQSPYGYLRQGTNYNRSPYITRYQNFNEFIGTDIYEYLKSYYRMDPKVFWNVYTDIQGTDMSTVLSTLSSNFKLTTPQLVFGGTGGIKSTLILNSLMKNYNISQLELMKFHYQLNDFLRENTPVSGAKADPTSLIQCDPIESYAGEDIISQTNGATRANCYCNPSLVSSADGLTELLNQLFDNPMSNTATYNIYSKISALDDKDKVIVLQNLCGSMIYPGEIYSRGSALDPIFWLLQTTMERFYQKIVLDDSLQNTDYSSDSKLSGHSTYGTASWLSGLKLIDETIDPSILSNRERFKYLTPSSAEYRQNTKYVYDHSDWSEFFFMQSYD